TRRYRCVRVGAQALHRVLSNRGRRPHCRDTAAPRREGPSFSGGADRVTFAHPRGTEVWRGCCADTAASPLCFIPAATKCFGGRADWGVPPCCVLLRMDDGRKSCFIEIRSSRPLLPPRC